jgi:hypothetical protein
MNTHSGLPALCDGGVVARQARAQIISKECLEEHDYRAAFSKLYADPHIVVTPDLPKDMLQRFVDTALTRERVDAMKCPIFPEGMLFKDLVLALFAVEQRMSFVLERHQEEMEPLASHGACSCFVIDDDNLANRSWPHALGRYYVRPMISDVYPGFLEVDIRKNVVTWPEVSAAHEVEVTLHALGPMPGRGTVAYTYDADKQEPSTGMFVCLSEGLCAWNRQKQRYDQVFPIAALRSLFCWCRVQQQQALVSKGDIHRA